MDIEQIIKWRIAVHEAGHAVVTFALGSAPGELGMLQDRQSAGFMGKAARMSDEDEAVVYAAGQVAEYLYCPRGDESTYNTVVAQLMADLPETSPHGSPDGPGICTDERAIELLACHHFSMNPLALSDEDRRKLWQWTVDATCRAMEILEVNEKAVHYLASLLIQQKRISKADVFTLCMAFATGGKLTTHSQWRGLGPSGWGRVLRVNDCRSSYTNNIGS